MNMRKLLIGASILVGIISFTAAGLANAHSFRSGDNVTIGQGEKVENTLFAAGRTVDINSEVFGDVFCAGQTVTVSGTIHGDVICAGQTVNVTGIVDGDVRLAAQTVTIGAQIAGNATIASQSFNLESTGKISGDVTIGSSDATINGPVGRDVAAGGNNLTIASEVGRDVKGTLNNLILQSSARVNGAINFTSNNDIKRSEGAVVGGEISRLTPSKPAASKRGAIFGFSFSWFLYWFFAMLFTAMILALLFPRALQAASNQAMPRPWKALLTGLLANLLMPFVLLLLVATVIGIPLAFMVGLAWLVVVLLSGPFFAYYLGRLILRDSKQPLLLMLVGASVLIVLYFIPLIGFFALIAAVWIGAGMLLLEAFNRTPRPAYTLTDEVPKRRP